MDATARVQLPDQLRREAGAGQELAEADACLEQAAADIRQLALDISQLARDVLKLLGDPESTNKTAETQSAPLGDITGEESEHEALFESLKKSLSVEQDSSAITIKHLDLALMLRAMREGSISPNELGERVKTGADLKVLQSLYQARDIEAPSLEKSLSELATGTQGSDTALGNISVALMRLFRETETRWKLASKAMPAVAEDVLRARFNTHLELQLRNQLQGLDSTITEQVLKQLQNESLGKCLSSVFGEVDKLRRASLLGERTMPMVSLMIATLREQLKLSTRAQGETQSQSWSLLAPEELVALARVMQEDERVAAPGPAVLGQTPR